ncbi:MAG TPA: AEC family transporter [Gammaproteobacteria bacterium]
MIAELANILLPVFCLGAVGYAWRRLGFPFEREFVTRLIMNVSGPCLVVDSLSRLELPLAEFLDMVLASVALLLGCAVAAFAILRLLKLSVRSYLPPLAIGNTGNMGLPLCLFAFGEEGLGLAIAVYVTNSVGQFTLTPMVQSRAPALRTLLTTPVVYGAVAGALVLALDVRLPEWGATTIGLLGDLMIPLMLLALGNTLGALKATRLKFALGMSVLRLVLGFAVTFAVSELFDLGGTARGVLVLQGLMPAAVFNYLFAARYERDPEDVASIVLVSTLLTALLLPLIVAYVLRL